MKTPAGQPDCCGKKSSFLSTRLWIWIAVVAVLLVVALVQAHGQSSPSPDSAPSVPPVQGRVVRLSFVQGQVQVASDGQATIDPAVANLPLVQGTVVQTGQDGRAEIQFDDGSVVRLAPNSRLSLDGLSGSASGSLATSVNLLNGEGYFELNPASGDSFQVDALGLLITAPEPASFRVSWLAQPEQVAVSDGYVRVKHASDYSVQVNTNETLSIDDQDVTRYLLSSGTDSDVNDAWNDQREQFLADADSRATGAPAPADGSADLDAYGNYYDMPGYGDVWQPYGYDASWSPYDDGYWAWYPWGYTWVSAYPWGWAPYHCGYWNYFDDFGWGWVGGGCGIGTWYPVGPWHGGPIGWHPPHRPIWHPQPPNQRLHPIGIVKAHPFQPVTGHPVPKGFKPGPVTFGGRTVNPLPVVPPAERVHSNPASHGGPVLVRPAFGSSKTTTSSPRAGSPGYGSRPGNPELGRGGSSSGRSAPPPRSSPPPAPHFSAPPASHSESSGSHK
jgi:hypothetical protein